MALMAIVSMTGLKLAFGHPPLFEDGSAQIEAGDRVILLGRNGCGKSTLLRCLAGQHEPDGGEIHYTPGATRGYLPQEVPVELSGTVYHIVAGALATQAALLSEYDDAARAVADDAGPAALDRLARAEEAVELADAWALHDRIRRAIADLGVDGGAVFEALSGGQKRRVLLARTLVGQPDLLLLDEPTNHLDIEAIQRLEGRLLSYPGTVVMVTHDRALARSLATRVLDIDRGRLSSWSCGYDEYRRRKEEALVREEAEWERFDQKLAKEEVWVRQGIKARRTRNEGRVRALLRMREQRAARRSGVGKARVRLQDAGRTGDMVIEAHDLGFHWQDGKGLLVEDFTTRIVRGDRIGVLGPNGSGKTTLLRLLLKELEATAGRVRHGTRLEVVYYDQLRDELDDDRTVLETVADGQDMIVFEGQSTHVHPYLANFLFTRDRMEQPVKALSGGERNRLVLARLFTKPCNVLVMDEPTNDLDVETLEILERVLIDFPGTLLLVSHDREFLDNLVTSTMVLEGAGRIVEYAGGYGDWLDQRPSIPAPVGGVSGPDSGTSGRDASPTKKSKPRPDQPRKLTYKETKELEALEETIAALEEEKDTIEATLADPDFYKGDPEEIAATNRRLPAIGAELEAAYARWEALETIREAASRR